MPSAREILFKVRRKTHKEISLVRLLKNFLILINIKEQKLVIYTTPSRLTISNC
jgi:hypothetical protein